MRGLHSASLLSSSFTMAPWLLITLHAGPERTAVIWGFWKALLLGKAVTISLRMTPVVSKFSHLIEAVMTSTYQFSSSVWSGEAIGQVNSTLGHGSGDSLSSCLHKAGILPNWSVIHLKPSQGNCGGHPFGNSDTWWEWWIHSPKVSWGFGAAGW